MKQADARDNCFLCKDVKHGTVLIVLPVSRHICVDCLLHEYDTTRGLMVTDRLNDFMDLVCDPENQPHQFAGLKGRDALKKLFFFELTDSLTDEGKS